MKALATIKSSNDVKVLVTISNAHLTSTTIKYGDKMFKLKTTHRNGEQSSVIEIFTDNGWKLIYTHWEIEGIVLADYVDDLATKTKYDVHNYWVMVDHLIKVFK